MRSDATVFIVDDDPAVRLSIAKLVRSKDLPSAIYSSAEEFLEAYDGSSGCLVADVVMKGMTGLELQEALNERGANLPVVLITAYADVPSAVRAMRAGAVTFLEKPLGNQELWTGIQRALELAKRRAGEAGQKSVAHQRLALLTPAERQVLRLLIAGKPNKAIASELDLGLRTVELRRAQIFKKMQAESLAELVSLVVPVREELDLEPR